MAACMYMQYHMHVRIRACMYVCTICMYVQPYHGQKREDHRVNATQTRPRLQVMRDIFGEHVGMASFGDGLNQIFLLLHAGVLFFICPSRAEAL